VLQTKTLTQAAKNVSLAWGPVLEIFALSEWLAAPSAGDVGFGEFYL